MEHYLQLAQQNQAKAHEIISTLNIIEAWNSIGAEINLIGSLKIGLLMKHLDIDFHVYTEIVDISQSFYAVSLIAQHPGVQSVKYSNLLNEEDECLEWHITYIDDNKAKWQIDIMHIVTGSKYDGYFERVGDGIVRRLTEVSRNTILKLKWETPDDEKIMGVEYYRAVLDGGVKTMNEFQEYRLAHPINGILEWQP